MAVPFDKLINYVSLLMHGDGGNGATTTVDSSPVPGTVTMVNGASLSTAQKKWGTASIFTDGTNDYVTVADSAPLRISGGDFTIEGWVYFPAVTGTGYVVTKGLLGGTTVGAWSVYRNGTALEFYCSSNGATWNVVSALSMGTVAAAGWYHFAVNRTGSVYRTYLNGAFVATATNAGVILEDAASLYIGSDRGTTGYGNQYLDDLRITKGYGRYPASCALPTAAFLDTPQPATDSLYGQVPLLLHGEGTNGSTTFTDSSGSPRTPTVTAGPVISTAQAKFGGSSILFNGSGGLAYATTPDFTLGSNFAFEAWVYLTAAETVDRCIYDNGALAIYTSGAATAENGKLVVRSGLWTGGASTGSAGTAIPLNRWVHIAVYLAGSTWLGFMDGNQQWGMQYVNGGQASSAALAIGSAIGGGAPMNGYVDSLRITQGSARNTVVSNQITLPIDPYPDLGGDVSYNKVSVLLHGEGVNGTNTFTDSSLFPLAAPTLIGTPTISTTQYKGGLASMSFNGTSQALSFANDAALNLATGDFTIELWFYQGSQATAQTLISKDHVSGTTFPSYSINTTTTGQLTGSVGTGTNASYGQTISSAASAVALNAWNHAAFVRAGTALSLFLNGVLTVSATQTGTPTDGGGAMIVARDGLSAWFNGYIDEVRITKGLARYGSTSFVPLPTPPDNFATLEVSHGSALLICPTPYTASGYGGASAQVKMPSAQALGFGAGTAQITMPAGTAEGHGPGYATLTGPSMYVVGTGHDTDPNAGITSMSPAQVIGYGGANAQLAMPTFQLVASGTTATIGSAALSMPAGVVAGSGTVTGQSSAQLTLTGQFVATGYGGANGAGTMGSPTAAGSGTATSVGSAAIVMPLFQLIATGSVGAVGNAALVMPMLRPVASGTAMLTMPGFLLVAIGSVHVVLTPSSYEAYAVNLSHDLPTAPGHVQIDETTRYTNFPFTQIVRFGAKHYGVGLDGLYELGGETDNGAPIAWNFRTGESDLDSPQKKRVLAAYLAGRLGPQAVITSHMGERAGGTTAYSYTSPRTSAAQNHRQKFGRGAKEIYFGLEVADASGGALFLEGLEFEVNETKRKI
jgi:hypothetical protein